MEKNDVKVSFAGKQVTLLGKEIKTGDKAPDFKAIDTSLSARNFSDFKGKVKIISTFPSIDTSICSAQMHRFNKEASMLDAVDIISVSNDLPFALGRFCGAEDIDKLEVLSDHKDVDFGQKYGFLIEEYRLLARGVVVIDKDDTVRHVEYVSEIGKEPDYEAALKVVKTLI